MSNGMYTVSWPNDQDGAPDHELEYATWAEAHAKALSLMEEGVIIVCVSEPDDPPLNARH